MSSEQAFAELGALSNFSFLEGASHPRELAVAAHALGMTAIGIADRNSVAGLVRGMVAAEQVGIRFVPGIRLCLDDRSEYLAWPADRAAWGRLCRMLSAARMQGEKGETNLTRDMVIAHAEGSVLARLPPPTPDADFARAIRSDANALNRKLALPLFCAVDHRSRGDDEARLDALAAIGVKLIAAGGVRYHARSRRRLSDVLTAIRLRTTVENLGYHASRMPKRICCRRRKSREGCAASRKRWRRRSGWCGRAASRCGSFPTNTRRKSSTLATRRRNRWKHAWKRPAANAGRMACRRRCKDRSNMNCA